MRYLFSGGKDAYKSNLHCHTTLSDGVLTPNEMKEYYTKKGYSIVAYTDHNEFVTHNHLSDENFLVINSVEMGINQQGVPSYFTRKTWHINLYAISPHTSQAPPQPTTDYFDIDGLNKYIADRVNDGFLVCYNHPYWSLQTYDEYSKIKGCFAMEIYNHNCEVDDGCNGYHPQVYDDMLRLGNKIFCVSTDDNHNRGPAFLPDKDSFGGFTYINSKSLKYEDVTDALARGDFYASQGPELYEISLDGKTLTVKCSPCKSVRVRAHGRVCYEIAGDVITEAVFQLTGEEEFIRVTCRDAEGNDANSNAYWL